MKEKKKYMRNLESDRAIGRRSIHLAAFRSDVGKCIEDMSQFICRQVLGIMVPSIDGLFEEELFSKIVHIKRRESTSYPVHKICDGFESRHDYI